MCAFLSYWLPQAKTCELGVALGHSVVRGLARHRPAPALHLDLSDIANIKPHTESRWTATYYKKNDLDKEKRWLKIRILCRIWHHTQLPKIHLLWNEPHTRILIFQATGSSSVCPQGVVNLLFPVLMQHNSSKWKVTQNLNHRKAALNFKNQLNWN